VFDSAFRFFLVERDEPAGWRLNLFDAATHKMLALMARGKARDYMDFFLFTKNSCPWAHSAGRPPARIRASTRS
jgi:hypothetical protein